MRTLTLALLSLLTFTYSLGANLYENLKSDDLIDTFNNTTSIDPNNFDFLVYLTFNISEEKVPSYLINVIYERTVEKNISTQDIFNIFKINNLTLDLTYKVLQSINVSTEAVFSLDGLNHTLELLHWTFPFFYTNVTTTLGLTGPQQRSALEALQINAIAFSSGIAFGDPNPWEEFKKGNFSNFTIMQACAAANTNIDDVFEAVRNLVGSKVVNLQSTELIQLLKHYSINKHKAEIIWNTVNVKMEDVYNVQLFRDLLSNISDRLAINVTFGVLLNPKQVAISGKTYDVIEEDKEVIDIHGSTLNTSAALTLANANASFYANIVILTDVVAAENQTLLGMEVGLSNKENLYNCTYVTSNNGTASGTLVDMAAYTNGSYVISTNLTQNVIQGSALVCNNKIYAIARELVDGNIVLDAFIQKDQEQEGTPTSSAVKISTNSLISFVLCIILAFAFT